MKIQYLFMIAASVLALGACEQKSTGEKITDKVGDAMDSRPNEKAKDAVEDVKDAAENAGEAVKDAAKDAGEAIKDGAQELKDKAKEATK